MDIEFDPKSAVVALVFYGIIMLGIWKITIGGGWPFKYKVGMSVVMLPLTYGIVYWQLNK